MGNLSQKVQSWWPSPNPYEPIGRGGEEDEVFDELDAVDDVRQRPVRFSWTDYFIFALLGMAMLWSW